ncbi:hypothetical protein [Streptomyces tropicalis]|uniref:Serine/arginine repetitive matrix protein 2 n=1 Tax=Streptomyces tropicalis TaxID=3034234 RepID=A0ABT6A0Y3_9ACTN|nr:hypothetical protein [Streptomyces tropicalis]MDF3298302.1 hypothetical protein [Streptomyces tropicalis]
MSGGQRYWNEESQRWEDAGGGRAAATAPVPARPDHLPLVPERPADPPPVSGPGEGRRPPQRPEPPGTPGSPGRVLWFKVAAGAAVVGVVAALVVVRQTGGHPAPSPTAAASASPAAQSPTDGPTSPGAGATGGTASASAPPDGYHTVHDPAGFAMAVPDGWERSTRRTGIFYSADGDRRLLQIFVVTEPGMTPLEAVQQSSRNLRSQPAYTEIGVDEVGAPAGASAAVGDDAARLVYAYDSKKLAQRRQVVEYAFTASDGKEYALLAAGPAGEWPRPQRDADAALASFCPSGGTCG